MPSYSYKCSACNKIFSEIVRIANRNVSQECECGGIADRDVESEIKHMCNSGQKTGDYYHVSESMGINSEQAAEHRKQWPDVDVLPNGNLGFKSVKEQQRYANHFGLDKKPQRIKR